MKTPRFLLAACASLAFALTFSCSDDGGSDAPTPSSSSGGGHHGLSSSSTEATCGGLPFTEDKFCFNDKIYSKCNGTTYPADAQFCLNNVITNMCGGKTFEAKEFCLNNKIIERCGGLSTGAEWDSAKGEKCCGHGSYNENSQFCHNDSQIGTKCGTGPDSDYNLDTQFCLGTEVKNKCDGKIYEAGQKCVDGEIKGECGSGDYDLATEFCQGGTTVKPLCGDDNKYDDLNTVCDAGVVKGVCADGYYNLATEFCLEGVTTPKCGSLTYTAAQFCQSPNVVKPLCGDGNTYDDVNTACDAGVVKPLCYITPYDPATQFCQEDSDIVLDRCGGDAYTTEQECCSDNTIELIGECSP